MEQKKDKTTQTEARATSYAGPDRGPEEAPGGPDKSDGPRRSDGGAPAPAGKPERTPIQRGEVEEA